MWYFTWILGLLLACSLGIINVLRLEAQETLAKEHLALDPLTQLLTQQSIWQRLREKVQNSKRNHAPFSLIFISLVDFMQRNPLSVHEHDAVVRDVVEVLKQALRGGFDLAARFECDSFLLVLTGISENKARDIAQFVTEQVLTTVKTSDQLPVSVQTGVGEYLPDADDSHPALFDLETEVKTLVTRVQNRCVA